MNDNLISFPVKARIQEEAALWIARLDGGPLSTEDADALRAWLAADIQHRNSLLQLVSTFDDTNVLAELAELFPLQKDIRQGVHKRTDRFSFLPVPVAAIAAGLMVLLVTVYFFTGLDQTEMDNKPSSAGIIYQTAIGEQQSYTLADGSMILMNTDSRIEVEFTSVTRAVRLVSGEANFDVAKNPALPFVVHTPMGNIRAVGTAFSVRVSAELVDVTVTEGRVEVAVEKPVSKTSTATAPQVVEKIMTLDAGQAGRFTRESHTLESISPSEIAQKLSWQQGVLVFEGEMLAEALREISRYTDKEIVIADEVLSRTRVGGYFKSDDIDATLKTLEDNFNIKVTWATPDKILLSARGNSRLP